MKFAVSKIEENKLIGYNNKSVRFDLLMLLPSFRGHSAVDNLEITDDAGFIVVDKFMRVQGLEKTYAAGDAVSFPGPKLASMAVRQGEVAAANIVSEIRGEELNETYYHEIATIIDQGGANTIYLYYGVWDKTLYRLKKGTIWSWVKKLHDKLWRTIHEGS